MVDALISGVSGETRAGSTPVIRTMKKMPDGIFFVVLSGNQIKQVRGQLPAGVLIQMNLILGVDIIVFFPETV